MHGTSFIYCIKFIAFLIIVSPLLCAQTICKNKPLRAFGDCKPISNCQQFMKILLNRQRSEEQASILRNSRCGSAAGRLPNLCCPFENVLEKASILPEVCGQQSYTNDLIFHYDDYCAIDEYPWTALIESFNTTTNERKLICGGTLISSRYVLTAAHCLLLHEVYTPPSHVRLGEYILSKDPDCISAEADSIDCADPAITIKIESFVTHELFEPYIRYRHNDIGLIRLSATAPYTDFIRPICLSSSDVFSVRSTNDDNYRLQSAGWGVGLDNLNVTDVKLKQPFTLANASDCQEVGMLMSDGDICVKGKKEYLFNSDKGVSLIANVIDIPGSEHYETWFVVGVAKDLPSFLKGNYTKVTHSFTRVDLYYDWIISKMKP